MNEHVEHRTTNPIAVFRPNLSRMLKTFVIVLFEFAVFASAVAAQSVNVKLTLNNPTVADVIERLHRQTGYEFSYDAGILSGKLTDVSVDARNERIETVLSQVFGKSDITFRVLNNRVFLKSNKAPENTATVKVETVQQQGKTITGTIVDANGDPVIGATVVVQGDATKGTVTDIDGNYILTGVPDNATLVVSYVGMRTQEVGVGEAMLVILQADAELLEEIVVVGYGMQRKVNVTGAITAIKTGELSNISTSNLSNTLAGRAPGVTIVGNSGMIGASSSIRMRGGFSEPLFVIDGIVRDKNAFDALEANEVDQLSFLKDAATASIYGTQAGNGVVLVTTKSGVDQKPVFNYQGSYTFMTPTMELLSDKTTATDELVYQNRVAQFLGKTPPNGNKEFAYFTDKNYNVNDYIWQTPWNQKHSLSVSGGGEKITYYALVGYIGEQGSYKNLENERFNLRSNVTARITESIKMNLNIAGNQQNHNRFYWPFSDDDEFTVGDLYRCTFNWPKTYPFYLREDGTPANEVTAYPVQTPMGSWQAWSVIDQVIGNRYIKTRRRETNAILSLDIDLRWFVPGLSTKIAGNYISKDYMRKKFLTYQKNYVWTPENADDNRFIPAAPDPDKINTFTFSQNQEFLSYDTQTLWSEQFNWFLNYNNNFGKHGLSGTIVFEQASNGGEYVHAKGEDPLTSFDQMFVYSTDAERRWGNAHEETGGRLSWIGRFNYNYAHKYITEFSFRYDGNTLFPKSKRWGFFPSVSAAWRIGQEPFMQQHSSWIDDLKLRASYGTTGNDIDLNSDNKKIKPFSFIHVYESGSSYIFGDALNLGIRPGATPNPYVTWATSTTYNVGLDYAFLKNKLSGSFDAFYRKETDILGTRIVTLPDTYGQSLAPENYAARSWKGFEFNILWRDRALDDKLDYSAYGNLGYSRDQWDILDQTALYSPGGNLEELSAVGHPVNRLVGFKTLGMIRTQEELDELLKTGLKQWGRDPYLGGLYFEDIRGDGYSPGPDGKIDGNDIQLLSDNAAPRINYGFGGSVTWKGITLDVHFQGVGMYDRMISNLGKDYGGMRQYGGAIRPYYPIWAGDVWTPENTGAKYPRPVGSNWYESGTGNQSFWIRNGAYLRLKNLNVGYHLPKNWVSRLGLISAQVFFNGSNLFFISPMKEFHDPEQDCYDSYPLMKSFTFGLDFKF